MLATEIHSEKLPNAGSQVGLIGYLPGSQYDRFQNSLDLYSMRMDVERLSMYPFRSGPRKKHKTNPRLQVAAAKPARQG